MGRLTDARIIGRSLVSQINDEGQGAGWWCAMKVDGKLVTRERGQCSPLVTQRVVAVRLLEALVSKLHFDGTWIVAWCDPSPSLVGGGVLVMPVPQRLVWMHKDKDGDVNVVVDTDDTLDEIVETLDQRVNDAALAMQKYREIVKDVEIRPDQSRKAAMGQASADPLLKGVPFVS
jgi:hypothetical protein